MFNPQQLLQYNAPSGVNQSVDYGRVSSKQGRRRAIGQGVNIDVLNDSINQRDLSVDILRDEPAFPRQREI